MRRTPEEFWGHGLVRVPTTGAEGLGISGLCGWADRFFSSDQTVQALAAGRARGIGDFSRQVSVRKAVSLSLPAPSAARQAGLPARQELAGPGQARKARFAYRLANKSGRELRFLFGTEFHLNLLDAHFNRVGEAVGVRRFSLVDPRVQVEFFGVLSRPARLWYFPVETRVWTGRAAERLYQGIRLLCTWGIRLRPGGSWALSGEVGAKSADVDSGI